MSTVNYNLKNKGIRIISSEEAWIKSKNGKFKLNPKFSMIGKIEMTMPNIIISTSSNKKPKYKGDTCNLNDFAKKQIVDYFCDDKGKRNNKTVVYLGKDKIKK